MAKPVQESRLAEWFRRWQMPLRKFLAARNAAKVADIDDIAQEVFLRLLRYGSAELVEHPQAYLFKVAANVSAEWALRARNRFEHDPRWLDLLVSDDQLDDYFDSEVVQREIQRALRTLTEREQQVIRLHFEDGLTHREIALRLGVTLRIVRRDFETSYGKLRRELGIRLTGALSHGRD